MLTIDLHLNEKAHVLARVVMLFHRLALEIEELHMSRSATAGILQIRICVNADPSQYARIQANLYKLVEVLSVENASSRRGQVTTLS